MDQKLLILDFGSQYTQLIARSVRECNVYCEIKPYNTDLSNVEKWDSVILSGSPYSAKDDGALKIDFRSGTW